ncbi:hypothetical protein G4D82_12255 [Flavobacterium sp. CYK-4]|uniref:hypothetical protein n=1 Tax=Flavobacterium lotistagni TaxID=2709660 RepID=UPI00140A9FC3|nr:hypothetical protein [Flavobacterium lotistagni]NHM07998.1 hypothetical protein [Flavobacterium lotistagni]
MKIIYIVLITFLIAIATSGLLEFEFFKNPIRYALVLLLIVFEIASAYFYIKLELTVNKENDEK